MLTDGTEHILCHGVRWHELVFEEKAVLGFRSFLCSYIYEGLRPQNGMVFANDTGAG